MGRSYIEHSFYCLNCGNKSVLQRKASKLKNKAHRKKLYCLNCKVEVNHYEVRNLEEEFEFKEMFNAGEFAEEAKQSIEYIKNEKIFN